jgi:ATP-binding cassette, subfamily B, bacterial MsbA
MTSSQTYHRLITYLKPYKARFLMAILSMTIYGATDGGIPYLLKTVLDDVFGKSDKGQLKFLVIALLCFSVIRGLFGFLEKYLSAGVGHSVVRDIRNDIFNKLVSMSPDFFEKQASGGLISRITNDALLVRTALTDAGASILRDTVRIIALLSVAIYLDPLLALIAVVGFPLCIYPVIRFGKRVKKLSRSGQEQFGGMTGLLNEIIQGHKVVSIFLREKFEKERFGKENDSYTAIQIKAEKYGALSSPTNEVLATLAVAAIIVYGALSVIDGVRTQGDFIAFITSIFLLYEPFKKLSRVNTSLQSGISAAERIFEIIDTKPTVKDEGGESLATEINTVHFDKVGFLYPNGARALDEISFEAQKGQTIALVGMSGSGKSTLVNLIPRFYDVSSGQVLINGKDIKNYTISSLRSQISLVGQNVFLFGDTIYNNIAYGKERVSKEDVLRAAELSYSLEFIQKLENGFESQVGEQGGKLSGGQRARIAIARALLKDSPILILDEATASLDNDSEEQVQKAIEVLMKGRTVFVIAHRLSTVRNADHILVMKDGRVVETGKHQELLALRGEYSRLYEIQFKNDDKVKHLQTSVA